MSKKERLRTENDLYATMLSKLAQLWVENDKLRRQLADLSPKPSPESEHDFLNRCQPPQSNTRQSSTQGAFVLPTITDDMVKAAAAIAWKYGLQEGFTWNAWKAMTRLILEAGLLRSPGP